MKSKEVIKILKTDGWYQIRQKGSHVHFHHNIKEGIVTVPKGNKDLPRGTLANIRRQAGLDSWS